MSHRQKGVNNERFVNFFDTCSNSWFIPLFNYKVKILIGDNLSPFDKGINVLGKNELQKRSEIK